MATAGRLIDHPTGRRRVLGLGALALAAAYGVSAAPAWAAPSFPSTPFTLGVASGDPLPDGVVLWTRLAPEPMAPDGLGGMPPAVVDVRWEVATDADFRRIVRSGVERAVPELAHSVHAEVSGLRPGARYFYRFLVAGYDSPVGRTRTAPGPGEFRLPLRFAVASCQSWAGGRYAAYRTMTAEDLDLVVHVGDYIYEQGGTETLADFRLQHALYKSSVDLQAAHAAFPFVVTFDDHEVENNWAGLISQPDNEPSNTPERFTRLVASGFQAYYEHLPLRRPQRPDGASMRLHRRLDWGRLARFHVLDTRQYRSDQLTEAFPGGPVDPRVDDPTRSLLGDAQERWLFAGLADSRATWDVIAQQTIMAQVDYDGGPGVSVNHDQWDGYRTSRNRLLARVAHDDVANPVVVTGDWHSAWVNDLATRPGETPVATEFVGTSISSGCGWAAAVEAAAPVNPHVRYLNARSRGYLRITADRDSMRSDYRVVASAADTAAPARTDATWVVESGRAGAQPG